MISSRDIRKGTCICSDGKLYFCIDFLHVKLGRGNTIMRIMLRDVIKGGQIERRFNIGEKLEDVCMERRPHQSTYAESEHYHFMNRGIFDDVITDKSLINGVDFMKEGEIVDVIPDALTDTVLSTDMPTKAQLEVTYTEPGTKGDTAISTLKPATVETGTEAHVPLFINEGEIIEVNTTDGPYVGRTRE